MTRKEAREWIVKFIFQITINETFEKEEVESFINHFEIDDKHREFIEGSIFSIIDNLEEIDEKIIANLIGWDFNRLYCIDKSILRVATNEILFDDNVPARVSINEAVEIAKKYSSEDSYRFINGVLGSISKGEDCE
ncbi:transcription antitermination factor NusB [Mediannikoviicoccus vaginalis]|uniref:transcription antitermination factor NusB n=1 Tax=Mediannikoviicoccus vaginalis TaxID=2899727 RepID=UPI001F003AC9|nr:transcription antitermination factor NusB [Mediannikoviicoccus vaginalis]